MKRHLVALVMLGLICGTTLAQDVDLIKLVKETQQHRQSKGNVDMVWWIPNEYWENSFKANPTMTPETQEKFIAVVDEYIVFSIMEGTIGLMGSISGTPKAELQSKTLFITGKTTLVPLKDADLSSDARNFFQMMKPLFANMLGQMGQSMEFIIFKGKNLKGEKYADPKTKGKFTLKLGDKEFKWRLPLAALLPPKYDSETGEEFPGNYIYNPFTGDKLTAEKPNKELKATDKSAP